MKCLNVILSIVVVLLFVISLRLLNITAILTAYNKNNQTIMMGNERLIDSNTRLERSLVDVKQQIEEFNKKLVGK